MRVNVSTASAQALVRGLVRAGVRDFVVCPGSRSAPLTYAIAVLARAGSVRAHVRIDERDAAFTALGLARAGRLAGAERPTAVVTTSGSAVGNLHPAVMEAAHSHVPLIVLSADRPARLRGTGANQTLDAQHLALPETVVSWDLGVRGGEAWLRHDEQLVIEAAHTALGTRHAPGCGAADPAWAAQAEALGADPRAYGGRRLPDALPGPVQLNVQFDVPLVPEAGDLAASFADGPAETFSPHPGAHAELHERIRAFASDPEARGVLVAGDDLGFASQTAAALASACGMPVFAEPSSALASHPHVVPAHAQVLADAGTAGLREAVTHVVVSGRPTLSRPVAKLLGRDDVVRIDLPYDLDGTGARQDDGSPSRVSGFCRISAVESTESAHSGDWTVGDGRSAGVLGREEWLSAWAVAGRAVVEGAADDASPSSPSRVSGFCRVSAVETTESAHSADRVGGGEADAAFDGAAAVRMLLERPGVLFAASSNAIRLLAAEQLPHHPARVLASRGLAGIDGLIATASGLALGLEDAGREQAAGPVRLLVGDLAALHDLGGLVVPSHERRPRLQIIVLNDDGGAIFSGLEHSAAHLEPYFARFFGTPHGLGLAAAAEALGWPALTVDAGERSAGAQALAAFLDSGEPGLCEIRLP